MELARIDLNKLHTFFTIADCDGVTAAARRLALTPSAVSQSLTGLEASLDLQLFNRVGRKLVLTREGEMLYRRFRDYQNRLQETLTSIADDREAHGLVRVGLFLGFPQSRLALFIARFSRDHPKVTTKIVYGSREELNAGLRDTRIDFAFSFDPKPGAGHPIRATKLFEQQLVLVTGKKYRRRRFDLDALRGVPIIDYYQSDPLIHRWIAHHYRRKPPTLSVRVWAATTNLVLELVLGQAGVGVLPHHVALPYVKRGRLSVVKTGRSEVTDVLWLKELEGAYRGPGLEAFRSAALDEFASA